MRFRIDLKIFLLVMIFLLTNQIQIYMLMMLFALLHELGHLLAGILLKMKPEKLEIIPVGITVTFQISTQDMNQKIGKANRLEGKKILVALAGPLTNLLIIVIACHMPIDVMKQLMIVYTNSFIFLFNMLPIYPLDGGRIVKAMLCIQKGKRKANKNMNVISITTTGIVSVLAIFSLCYNYNIAIILIMIYIWILVLRESQVTKQKEKIYQILDKNY